MKQIENPTAPTLEGFREGLLEGIPNPSMFYDPNIVLIHLGLCLSCSYRAPGKQRGSLLRVCPGNTRSGGASGQSMELLQKAHKGVAKAYPEAPRQFLFGLYIIIPKEKVTHNQKGTTLEPLGSFQVQKAYARPPLCCNGPSPGMPRRPSW